MRINLIGVGMGAREQLTVAAERAIAESEALIGASRLLEQFPELEQPKYALVRTEEIVKMLQKSDFSVVSVLFSGDIGFYSGARLLYPHLEGYDVKNLPGISSLSYFAAACGQSWQDVHTISCHGRKGELIPAVQQHFKTFILTGGDYKVEVLSRLLEEAGLGQLEAWAGEYLSYPEERILHGTVAELAQGSFADLSVMLVENPHPIRRPYQTAGLPDCAFQRGSVPMTKEEVRTLAVSKLQIDERNIVWDVGAGTGSVSVECAQAASGGTVYAIERNEEGYDLIRGHAAKFGLTNLKTICGTAPAALAALPAPDRVFVGGSGGELVEILQYVLERNPSARIVLTAITLETITDILQFAKSHPELQTEFVQVSVSRGRIIGQYNLMKAENPVYLVSLEAKK